MKHKGILIVAVAVVTGVAIPANADTADHSSNGMQDNTMPMSQMQGEKPQGMMPGMHDGTDMMGGAMMGKHAGMMQMMMQMHGGMMGDMHGDMMGRMHSGMMGGKWLANLDADGDGKISSEEFESGMANLMKTYDADGNGTLSIAEFEGLHSSLIRETMVDRFQNLDADGDGEITQSEVSAAAQKITARQPGNMHGHMSKTSKND